MRSLDTLLTSVEPIFLRPKLELSLPCWLITSNAYEDSFSSNVLPKLVIWFLEDLWHLKLERQHRCSRQLCEALTKFVYFDLLTFSYPCFQAIHHLRLESLNCNLFCDRNLRSKPHQPFLTSLQILIWPFFFCFEDQMFIDRFRLTKVWFCFTWLDLQVTKLGFS